MHICTLILRTLLLLEFYISIVDNIFRNKDINHYISSPEWEADKMKLQTMLRDTERERAIKDLKNSAKRMRQLGVTDSSIYNMLKEDYHGKLSDEEIRKYMDETK